jgi:hypothetical protein
VQHLDVLVKWQEVTEIDDARLRESGCLYAYVHPHKRELLYVGRCWGTTPRSRLGGPHKHRIAGRLRRRGIKDFRMVVGFVHLRERDRFTRQVLADVESLLIFEETPGENNCCTRTRIRRPGLRVYCSGRTWPGRRVYLDP